GVESGIRQKEAALVLPTSTDGKSGGKPCFSAMVAKASKIILPTSLASSSLPGLNLKTCSFVLANVRAYLPTGTAILYSFTDGRKYLVNYPQINSWASCFIDNNLLACFNVSSRNKQRFSLYKRQS